MSLKLPILPVFCLLPGSAVLGNFSVKELTVWPGREVTITDKAAYGMIMMQGHGKMGVWDIESPTLIRYGQQAGMLGGGRNHRENAREKVVIFDEK
jgi:hypothetical protein